MKRCLISSVAVVGLMLAAPSFAFAQTPEPTTIEVDKACGAVTVTFTGPASEISGVHGFRWNAVNGEVATDVGVRTGTVVVGPGQSKDITIFFTEDEFDGLAAVTVSAFFGPNTHLQPFVDIYPVDTDCLSVTPAPTTTVASTPTSAPVTTSAVTPVPTTSNSDVDDSVTVIPSDAPETGDGSTNTPLPMRIALIAAILNLVGLSFVRRDLLEGLRR